LIGRQGAAQGAARHRLPALERRHKGDLFHAARVAR
jgi:hypothetical protein